MLYKKLNRKNIPENAIGSADTVKFYVFMPGFAGCLLAGLGWNWLYSKNKFEKLVHLFDFIKRRI